MTQNWPDLVSLTQATQRVALLIDGDNIPLNHVAALQAFAAKTGDPVIRRVYCDNTHLKGWVGVPGLRAIHSGAGKNATDMLLVIDAMALAYVGAADLFVIASSDRDFAHLAHHLREKGHRVIGVGEGKTPDAFRAACSAFVDLLQMEQAVALPIRETPLEHHVKAIIKKANHSKGALINTLEPSMQNRQPGFKIASHPQKSWRAYLTAHPTLYACDPRGPQARVRWIGG